MHNILRIPHLNVTPWPTTQGGPLARGIDKMLPIRLKRAEWRKSKPEQMSGARLHPTRCAQSTRLADQWRAIGAVAKAPEAGFGQSPQRIFRDLAANPAEHISEALAGERSPPGRRRSANNTSIGSGASSFSSSRRKTKQAVASAHCGRIERGSNTEEVMFRCVRGDSRVRQVGTSDSRRLLEGHGAALCRWRYCDLRRED
jgi:hypothetical protein